jgi:energy-converting hydrogenase Eha subunit B
MKTKLIIVAAALLFWVGSANCTDDGNLGTKTVGAVTGTAQSAVSGTATVAETSVTNTVAAPLTAVQAVKDTANTAFTKTDAAIKAFTGEDS